MLRGHVGVMHELFEHTADLGLRATAPDLNTLFEEMATCLFSAIIEDATAIRTDSVYAIEIPGIDREFLLFDWLRELLFRFDAGHMLFGRFEVRVHDEGLTASVWGEQFDPTRHVLSREVKAITYHDLSVSPSAEGWLAEVIVDI